MTNFQQHSPREWARIEAVAHDEVCANQCPFGLKQYKFTVERAIWYLDYCYKEGLAGPRTSDAQFLEKGSPVPELDFRSLEHDHTMSRKLDT